MVKTTSSRLEEGLNNLGYGKKVDKNIIDISIAFCRRSIVPIIENFASHVAVQEFVDAEPDWARSKVFRHRVRQLLQRLIVFGSDYS